MIHPRKNLVLAFALTVAVLNTARASNFIDLAFYPAPKANDRRGWAIQNFGPVGIGIQLEQGLDSENLPKDFRPGYTIYIRKEHTTQE